MAEVVIVALAVGAFGWLTADQWQRSQPPPPPPPPLRRRPPGWALGQVTGRRHPLPHGSPLPPVRLADIADPWERYERARCHHYPIGAT